MVAGDWVRRLRHLAVRDVLFLSNFVAIPGDAVQSDQNAADGGGWGAGKVFSPIF